MKLNSMKLSSPSGDPTGTLTKGGNNPDSAGDRDDATRSNPMTPRPSRRASETRWTLELTRRDVLRLAGAAGATAWIGGHGSSATGQTPTAEIVIPETSAALPTEPVTFRWIDNGDEKRNFMNAFFAAYQQAHPNITVQYDALPGTEIAEIVPLGIRSGNAHDVLFLGPSIPAPQAVSEGWVAPIDDIIPDFAAWKAAFPPGVFVEGINMFNGLTYGFPTTSTQRYARLLLYNAAYMKAAGFDPAAAPLTWEEFREAARVITEQGAGEYYGMVIGGGQPAAWEDFIGGLAEGASGLRFFDWRTGEYAYTHDSVLVAIDLLLAMRDDGSIFPGSVNLNNPQSRATMPQGAAGMIIQGPWNITEWQRESPDFAFGVSSQPVPTAGTSFPLGYGPGGANTLWVYVNSPHKAIAGDMFAYIGSPAGQTAWAQLVSVGSPPAIITAFEGVELDPLAQRAYGYSRELMRLRPDPRIRNPATSQVFLQQRPITPDIGEVIQGIYSGQVSDPEAAMQELQDRASAELDRAIQAARDAGAEVSRDDWVFPDWDPAEDYTPADAATPTG